MTGEQVPNVPAPESAPEVQVRDLTDEEIMERAKQINEAREIERQEELKRAEAVKKAEEERKAEEVRRAEEIHRAEEEQKAAKIAEAERLKKLEEEKKAEELRRARELVREDDARRAAEEKAAEKPKKKHTGLKVFLVILVILLIGAGITAASVGVTNDIIAGGATLPYQATYNIWLPQGPSTVAGMTFTAVGDNSSVMLNIPEVPTQTIQTGETMPPISHKMTLSLFWGKWNVMVLNYSAELTYRGVTPEDLLAFGAVIKTDRQIPEWLFNIALSASKIQYSAA